MNAYLPRLSAGIWLLGMLLLGVLGFNTLNRDWLETGFLALLPKIEQRPDVAEAIERHNALINRKVIWLIGASGSERAIANAEQLEKRVRDSGLFGSIMMKVNQEQGIDQYRRLFAHRYRLLDPETRRLLKAQPQGLFDRNLEMLYSPAGQLQAVMLEHDPLLLFWRYMNAQKPANLNLEQGVVTVRDGQKVWVLLQADLDNGRLPLDKLEKLLQLSRNAAAEIQKSGGELRVSGLPLFTADGAESARQEISTVGIGSGIGIVLLFLWTFRSIRPLLLSAAAIASGLAAALVVSVWMFGKIHIITLVFGASLIGVVDDYAQHYLCDSFGDRDWNPRKGLAAIFPALFLGLISNLLSYVGLGFSPFPGLQEVALFSAVGLFAAWLTVVLLFPLLLAGFRFAHEPALLKLALIWERRWPDWAFNNRRWLGASVLIVLAGGMVQLAPRDDVRLLQSASPALLRDAEKIRQLLQLRDNQFFLVSGKNQQEWHVNEQRLLEKLDALIRRDALKSYEGLSRYWPDPETQQSDYRLVQRTLFDSGLVKRYMADLGFDRAAIAAELKTFAEAERGTLKLEDWLAAADAGKRSLWLGCTEGRCAGIVALSRIRDASALASLEALPGVVWVDHVEELSSLFARYRIRASVLLFAAFALVSAGLCFKFGRRGALTVMSIPLVASLAALALTGWFNQLFSLFNLFALLLVLGIGVDYAAFFYLAGERRTSTSLAVTLSGLTTLLSFGLLSVSSTEIVHAFGFTVGVGIMAAMLAAPLIGRENPLQEPKAPRKIAGNI
ncbi:MMPL family transporter [Candidatus Methylomicrobium oryzae]|uniref:MMPL family transporter n=1 Tax=Candidatus Methylomicrobium oryzae TaxID=2802053 RepID=UPI0019237C8B|nr:transporter [Methylomicrobium sp. RS1]MBL1263781.1 transporter [Methylomicrobium sp. RS1]